MGEPNDQLRRARERIESPYATGESLSRQELAELVNAWVYEHTEDHRVIELDANYIGKLEQGTIRWLRDPERRAAFRAVLGVTTDAELGFRRPRRSRITLVGVERQQFLRVGLGVGTAAVAGPAALVELLVPAQPARIPSVVGMAQVAEVRATAEAFAGWDARYGGGLMREAVTAQLRYCAELLNGRCCEAVRASCSPRWARSPRRPGSWRTTTTRTTTPGGCTASRCPAPRRPGTGTCGPMCCPRCHCKPRGVVTRTGV